MCMKGRDVNKTQVELIRSGQANKTGGRRTKRGTVNRIRPTEKNMWAGLGTPGVNHKEPSQRVEGFSVGTRLFRRPFVCHTAHEYLLFLWKQIYLLCVSQLFKVGQRCALGLAGSVCLAEVHRVLAAWRAQEEDSSCVG